MITKENFIKELKEIEGFLFAHSKYLEEISLIYKKLDKKASNEDYYSNIENEIQNIGAALEKIDAVLDDERTVFFLSCRKLQKKLDD